MFINFIFDLSSPEQGFISNNEGALAELFENEEDTHKGTVCLKEMAARIAMVFVSLKVHRCMMIHSSFFCWQFSESLLRFIIGISVCALPSCQVS